MNAIDKIQSKLEDAKCLHERLKDLMVSDSLESSYVVLGSLSWFLDMLNDNLLNQLKRAETKALEQLQC